MKKFIGWTVALVAGAIQLHAAGFTEGNLAVLRVGDGTTLINSSASALFIDEYTPSGVFVQSIAVSTDVGTRAVGSGSASSDGILTLSGNGQYLTFGAYDAAVGTASIVSGTGVARVIGVVGTNGAVDTSTRLTASGTVNPPYNGNNFRAVYSPDGTTFYLAGTSGSANNSGIQYVSALGATSSTNLSTTITNTRGVNVFNGQLYLSTGSGSVGIYSIGSGVPTTTPQTAAILPGGAFTASAAYTDFYFSTNGLTLITLSGSTMQAFAFNGSSWTLSNSFTTLANSFNLTASESGGTINLFYTTGNGSTNNLTTGVTNSTLRAITWNGTSFGSDTVLAVAGNNQTFKGVEFAPAMAVVPEPSTVLLVIAGLGAILGIRRRR